MTNSRRQALFVICGMTIAGICASGALANDKKVEICHIPPGNPDNAHTITISENALTVHLDHGDTLGPCEPAQPGVERDTGDDSPSECHRQIHAGSCDVRPGADRGPDGRQVTRTKCVSFPNLPASTIVPDVSIAGCANPANPGRPRLAPN